jgi:LPS O-antigen subunit length determinant protein (WzzB/FepE family)
MNDQNRKSTDRDLVKEIDLIALLKTVWKDRIIVIKTIIIFSCLGLIIALFSQKEYSVSAIMVPQVENQSSNLGGLSSLASLAGVNMDMNTGSNAISPKLYPMIISSASFQLEIMNTEFQFDEIPGPMSLLDYYINEFKPGLFGTIKKYTIGLPSLIMSGADVKYPDKSIGSIRETIQLTKEQEEVRKIVEENLSLDVNENDGYLTLVSRFHQAYLSAQVAKTTQKLLQEYVTKLKIEKAAAQLEFIKERYVENKGEFEEAQSRLAAFRDANKNISSETLRTHEERLQNEYQLAFEVYSELAKQMEQAMIKVEEDTPVFSVIKDIVVPIEKSKPRRSIILIVWFLLGGIVGIGWVFVKNIINQIKSRWDISEEGMNSENQI